MILSAKLHVLFRESITGLNVEEGMSTRNIIIGIFTSTILCRNIYESCHSGLTAASAVIANLLQL